MLDACDLLQGEVDAQVALRLREAVLAERINVLESGVFTPLQGLLHLAANGIVVLSVDHLLRQGIGELVCQLLRHLVGLGLLVLLLFAVLKVLTDDGADLVHVLTGQHLGEEFLVHLRHAALLHLGNLAAEGHLLTGQLVVDEVLRHGEHELLGLAGSQADKAVRPTGDEGVVCGGKGVALPTVHDADGLAAEVGGLLSLDLGGEVQLQQVTLGSGTLHRHELGARIGHVLQGLVHLLVRHVDGGQGNLQPLVLRQLELGDDGGGGAQGVRAVVLLLKADFAVLHHGQLGVLSGHLVLQILAQVLLQLGLQLLGVALGYNGCGGLAGAETRYADAPGDGCKDAVLLLAYDIGRDRCGNLCLAIAGLVDGDIHLECVLEICGKSCRSIVRDARVKSKRRIAHDAFLWRFSAVDSPARAGSHCRSTPLPAGVAAVH